MTYINYTFNTNMHIILLLAYVKANVVGQKQHTQIQNELNNTPHNCYHSMYYSAHPPCHVHKSVQFRSLRLHLHRPVHVAYSRI